MIPGWVLSISRRIDQIVTMQYNSILYHGYRLPQAIIRLVLWLFYGFCPGFRDVEDLLAERGNIISYESILVQCLFGSQAVWQTLSKLQKWFNILFNGPQVPAEHIKTTMVQFDADLTGYTGSAFPVSCVTFSIPITTQVVSIL